MYNSSSNEGDAYPPREYLTRGTQNDDYFVIPLVKIWRGGRRIMRILKFQIYQNKKEKTFLDSLSPQMGFLKNTNENAALGF